MKFNLSIDIDIPNNEIGNGDAIPWATQIIFDRLVNFAIIQHLESEFKWMAEKPKRAKDQKEVVDHLIKRHSEWADILREAEKTMKITKVL
jgi:hypothetical protein